jgi:hypothetical protein
MKRSRRRGKQSREKSFLSPPRNYERRRPRKMAKG